MVIPGRGGVTQNTPPVLPPGADVFFSPYFEINEKNVDIFGPNQSFFGESRETFFPSQRKKREFFQKFGNTSMTFSIVNYLNVELGFVSS